MLRRDFLRRTSLALAGGLIVGDQAIELFERLSHRKVFALGGLPWTGQPVYFDQVMTFGAAMIPDGGYECVASTAAPSVWTGPGSVNWKALGLDPAMENACLTFGQRAGYVDTIYPTRYHPLAESPHPA